MPSTFEYMQFATKVYAASLKNEIDAPDGWIQMDWVPDRFSGFSAGYFINANNEVVISYTGTNSVWTDWDFSDQANWLGGGRVCPADF